MSNDNHKRGLVARVLGDQPTALQKVFFWLMVSSILLWPLGFFISVFFFDAPFRSTIDVICRCGMALTIWLYPLYLLPLIGLWFRLSKRLRAPWLFYLCPLIPVALFYLFVAIASSEFAASKPEGYDSSTFKRLDETYATDVNHVYFYNEVLEKADPASFRVLNNSYASDARHVWYRDGLIEGADPASFVAADEGGYLVARDDHDFYRLSTPLHVADMGTFKVVDGCWAVDSKYVYYLGEEAHDSTGYGRVHISDYQTFRVLNHHYAADDLSVYYEYKIVKGADPGSFALLMDEQKYAQDKNRVYYQERGTAIRDFNALKHKDMDKKIWNAFHTDGTTVYNPKLQPMPDGCDFATIYKVEPYREWYADKNRVYYENRILSGATPTTFKIFPIHYVSENYVSDNNKSAYYSYDGNRVYYRDSLMLGVDVPSFICGYDYVNHYSFAFDKNRYYEGSPNPRLEKLRQGKCQVEHE